MNSVGDKELVRGLVEREVGDSGLTSMSVCWLFSTSGGGFWPAGTAGARWPKSQSSLPSLENLMMLSPRPVPEIQTFSHDRS